MWQQGISLSRVSKCALKCPRCCSCCSHYSETRKGALSSGTHRGQEPISQRLTYHGDLEQSLLCQPKSPQVSGELCLDSRPCLHLSPAHCTGLAPTRSRRSYSPRTRASEKKALSLLNESLRRIKFFFFLSKL